MNFGVPGKIFAPELSRTVRNLPEPRGTFRSLSRHFQRNLPELHEVSVPEPAGTSPSIFSAKTCRNLPKSRKLPELHPVPVPKPYRTYNQVSTPYFGTLYRVPAPETSGTSRGIYARTLWNLTRTPPEPHEVSALRISMHPF